MHAECLASLPLLFADGRYQRALRMQPFSPQHLATHLPTVLPDGWMRQGGGATSAADRFAVTPTLTLTLTLALTLTLFPPTAHSTLTVSSG